MDINDLHPPDDYTHRFFIWHEWIQANGPLTPENVFDYFATSMFYDKQSNNQVLRMQTMHTGVPINDEAAELRRFTGVEFAVVHAQPPTFFVIQKRERLSPDEVRPLAAYFIMNNRIYQSPDVYTVLSNRLLTSVSALQNSLDILRKHRPDYTPRSGFVWPITDPSVIEAQNKRESEASVDAEADSAVPQEKRSGIPKRQQNNMLLMHAMNTTAAHLKVSLATSSATQNLENTAAETPVTTTIRSSVTPAPMQLETGLKVATPQEATKGPAAGGKKRKKRTSLAPPPAPS
ncbi:MED6-domain-containing protein [Gymnopilus junonius]|uniref:Mediator of RNA polymerase II transcription subunit 6 n=1 Tax=Gymnopilus junonius TaxID=109634 RepID=A0A9P5TQG8_GYMJU|nr:MED6-domain-containing protein [Gymnopilus junonius]